MSAPTSLAESVEKKRPLFPVHASSTPRRAAGENGLPPSSVGVLAPLLEAIGTCNFFDRLAEQISEINAIRIQTFRYCLLISIVNRRWHHAHLTLPTRSCLFCTCAVDQYILGHTKIRYNIIIYSVVEQFYL